MFDILIALIWRWMFNMSNEKAKAFTRRSKEELVAELDRKIAFHQQKIKLLEAKKKTIYSGRLSRNELQEVLVNAKKDGLSLDDIAEKLGLDL